MSDNVAPPRLTIIIPAYNEESRIIDSLNAIGSYVEKLEYSCKVLIVDDGSTDATLGICRKFAKDHPWLQILGYHHNKGKGHAVRAGMLHASSDFLLFLDADLATPIEELDGFWRYIDGGADIVIASRPLHESHLMQRQPFYRELAGRMLNHYIQLIAVPGIRDTQCGFKLFRNEAAKHVFAKCIIDGFSFDIEALHVAQKLGYTIKEAPVHWYHRSGSKVKLLRDGLRMLSDIRRIRSRHRRLKK